MPLDNRARSSNEWRWTRWLMLTAMALFGLGACGGGGGGEAAGSAAGTGSASGGGAEAVVQPSGDPARTFYRLTRVGPAGASTGVIMNASGQVAGHFVNEQGQGGFFFDPVSAQSLEFATPTGTTPGVQDMNDAGQIVGYFHHEDGAQEAFSWTRSGGLVRIAPLSSATVTNSVALDVNQRGQVVGTLLTSEGERAFLWSRETGLRTDLARGMVLLRASRINDSGRIAAVGLVEGEERAVLVEASDGSVIFVAPSRSSGGPDSAAVSHLNNAGQVAGTLQSSAFFSQGGSGSSPVDVGRLTGLDQDTYVQSLNEKGQILVSPISLDRAFYWSLEDGLLEMRADNRFFLLFGALNTEGVAVGVADRPDAQRDEDAYAVAWTRQSGSVDLNTRVLDRPAGLNLRSARAINDQGYIMVYGDGDGEGGGTLLLTPVADEGAPPGRSTP